MYQSFIRSLLTYNDAVLDNYSNEFKKQFDPIHHEAARIITGGTKLCSIKNSYLNWDGILCNTDRLSTNLLSFYKIINLLTPVYPSDLLSPVAHDNVTYNLRNANNMHSLRARTNLFCNSFFPSTIHAWNELSDETKGASTISAF